MFNFLDGEVVVDGKRLAGLLLEQAGFEVERIRQAVGPDRRSSPGLE